MFESPTKMSRNVQPETSRRSLETLVVRARRSATTRIAPRWLREHHISHFFQAVFPAQAVNVCFRSGTLHCRPVRWRFDSPGSRGSVLSEQKSLPYPGACIIGFNDLKTINVFKTSWCALCRHFPWSQVIAEGRIAPKLPATLQGG